MPRENAVWVEQQIAAPVRQVWALLTDADSWRAWNPDVRIEGRLDDRRRITVGIRGEQGLLRVRVHLTPRFSHPAGFDRPSLRVMTWVTRKPLGLLRQVRTFTVHADGTGSRLIIEDHLSTTAEN